MAELTTEETEREVLSQTEIPSGSVGRIHAIATIQDFLMNYEYMITTIEECLSTNDIIPPGGILPIRPFDTTNNIFNTHTSNIKFVTYRIAVMGANLKIGVERVKFQATLRVLDQYFTRAQLHIILCFIVKIEFMFLTESQFMKLVSFMRLFSKTHRNKSLCIFPTQQNISGESDMGEIYDDYDDEDSDGENSDDDEDSDGDGGDSDCEGSGGNVEDRSMLDFRNVIPNIHGLDFRYTEYFKDWLIYAVAARRVVNIPVHLIMKKYCNEYYKRSNCRIVG